VLPILQPFLVGIHRRKDNMPQEEVMDLRYEPALVRELKEV
jgi:hypothetical protein